MSLYQWIATSSFGLEAVVRRQLQALGYDASVVRPGRLLFEGDLQAGIRANIHLRSADRVMLLLGRFPAPDFDALFDTTMELPWQDWIPSDGEFPVVGRSRGSQLTSVPAVQRTVKKAIVEKLKKAYKTETLPETGPLARVEIALLDDEAMLSIDTTGDGLNRRGYRRLVGQAPLKETLAAAMIELSFWRAGRPLIDPFCGSGTIPIEAAMIGRRIAPGLERSFAAEDWPCIDRTYWEEVREAARAEILPELPERLIGTDIDPEQVSLARYHAERAGVASDIHFQERPFDQLASRKSYGCLITNPPYGERIGEEEEVIQLYRSMPEILRRLPTWSHYILAARRDFEQLIGQKADRRRKLYNGRIECTYFQFHGPRPPREDEAKPADTQTTDIEEKIEIDTQSESKKQQVESPKRERPAPVFGGLRDEATRQQEEFRGRLKKMARHLRRWPTRRGITCFRIYHRDVPEVPLVIDRYEQFLHITEYERPHDRTPGEHADWLDLMIKTAGETLEVPRENIFFKRRQKIRQGEQYTQVAEQGREEIVGEGGLKFMINLTDYIDTGLFLDHRITRSMVRDLADGTRFLNLFGYTGSFTVYAAAGGARSSVTIDLSPRYLQWARRNLELNGIDDRENHRMIDTDAMSYLQTIPPGSRFDLVVVDPPTFSNSRQTQSDWDVQQDHAELLTAVLERTAPGGNVFFSTNFRRFKLNQLPFEHLATVREISKQTVPEDFRDKRIHRCWRMVRNG